MTEKIKVAVIGVGYLGKFHARIYSQHPDVDLIGVVDTHLDQAQEIASNYSTEPFTDYQQVIDQVDAVSIVVPTTHHFEVAMPFIKAGVNILLEKPIAATVEQAKELVKAADENSLILQIGHLERFNAGIVALSELVDTPRFIEAHRLGEFTVRATDVDVVTDLMIHDIDIILSLTKSNVKNVSAVGSKVLTDEIDIANARLEFENGSVANVTASRVSNKKFRRIRVFAPDKYLAVDFNAQNVEVITKTHKLPDQPFAGLHREVLDIQPVQPLDAEIDNFVGAVRGAKKPAVSGHDGLAALAVANLVKQRIYQNPLV